MKLNLYKSFHEKHASDRETVKDAPFESSELYSFLFSFFLTVFLFIHVGKHIVIDEMTSYCFV